jgi:hypothetical protein
MISPSASKDDIPFWPYKLFFLYIEPVSALAGAYYAAFLPSHYLGLLTLETPSEQSLSSSHDTSVGISLAHLANLYLLFAINEHVVLRSSSSVATWRALLFGLLVADLGHLVTMAPLGAEVYWKVWDWNAMIWGSVGFVYLGASLRMAFLLGWGIHKASSESKDKPQ